RGSPVALYALLSLVPLPGGRLPRCVSRSASSLLAVARGQSTERAPCPVCLGKSVWRRARRSVRAPGRGWPHCRPASGAASMTADSKYETHDYDVLIVGAGGAGLRAAIEASAQGARTALICKSLLGKAHTVMAEGGIAAAMGNVWPEDNWKVHFRDTMRGGKMLNNWRMAQIHAQEAPDR